MTQEEKDRLIALRAKSARSAEEQKEMDALVTKETASTTPATELTREKFIELLTPAIKAALPEGLVTEAKMKEVVETAVKSHFGADAKKGFTKEDAQKVVDDAIKAAQKSADDAQAVKDADDKRRQKALDTQGSDISFKDAAAMVIEGIKGLHGKSRMQHDLGVEQGKRAGNLSIADRQLCNIMLHGVGLQGKALEDARDRGIDSAELAKAVRGGDQMLQKLANTFGRAQSLMRTKTGFDEANSLLADTYGFYGRAGSKDTISTTATGSGLEFIPRDLSSELLMRLFLESRLAARFAAQEIMMVTDPYPFPLSTTRPQFYGVAQGSNATLGSVGTSQPQLASKKAVGYLQANYEMEEDSIVPILPFMRMQLGLASAEAYETMIINGDNVTPGTHMDSDIQTLINAGGNPPVQTLFFGLRKMALAGGLTLDMSSGGITRANVQAMRKLMKRYGMRPTELFWLAGENGYYDLMYLNEIYTRLTYDKPTLESGVVTQYQNIEIIPSSFVREDLNASGVYDGTTTTQGSLYLVNGTRFLSGRRREFMVEMFRDIRAQQTWLVASFRKAFTPIETPSLSAGISPITMGFNYSALAQN